MVCSRCKMVIKEQLIKFGINPLSVELGEVEIAEELSVLQKEALNKVILSFGFDLIDDKRSQLIEKIKNTIVELVQTDTPLKLNVSTQISQLLHHDYSFLSNLFSEIEGTTIEKYFIAQKIERVKELLKYDELSISQIADQLGYSSVAYLSNQFKKETGLTPSFYKSKRHNNRINLDEL